MPILISTTTNLLHVYYVNIVSHEILENIVIAIPNKENGVAILDQKLYDDATKEKSLDTSKFETFNEDPILKCEASFEHFLDTLQQK